MMSKKIYTLGYSGRTLDDLVQIAQALEATILDIRLSPRSRRPDFNQKRLVEALGQGYVHVPELGNINYKSGGPVQIADLAAGLAIIVNHPGSVILMCACKTYEGCHRSVVAEALHEQGFITQELTKQERG